MTFEHELIIAILNEGYSDLVMDAARSAGAGGVSTCPSAGSPSGETAETASTPSVPSPSAGPASARKQ